MKLFRWVSRIRCWFCVWKA